MQKTVKAHGWINDIKYALLKVHFLLNNPFSTQRNKNTMSREAEM